MSALTIILIRHAEKPAAKPGDPDRGPGLTSFGETDKHSLVVRGWQRAGAWAALFGCGLTPGGDYPTPDIVYAANPDEPPTDGGDASRRPDETVTPLCGRLGLSPRTSYAVGEEGKMVAEVCALAGVVLVCWEHKHIVDPILTLIAGKQKIPQLPTRWNGDRFDLALRFDRSGPDAPWSFRQLFPRLLAGDTDVPLT
ncbi:histidine phosphatase family protein [Methylocella silvestris]|uniref:Histidine phosphatase family protein n=1 Tax=Methylocella silvestris TaxID=199596 RepID=A0A2J7TGC8_METSI|nr:histidine phosphatase family protein [Methylocella silvestris]PNG25832.1 histidine phosphatase family protein [Methylocella silvestris]